VGTAKLKTYRPTVFPFGDFLMMKFSNTYRAVLAAAFLGTAQLAAAQSAPGPNFNPAANLKLPPLPLVSGPVLNLPPVAAPGAGGASQSIVGSGRQVTSVRELPVFTSILQRSFVNVDATSGQQVQYVHITGDDNIVPLVKTEVVDEQLVLSIDSSFGVSPKIPLVATVSAVEIRSGEKPGTGNFSVKGIFGGSFRYAQSGTGNATFVGNADKVSYTVSGTGILNGTALTSRDASVTARGTGRINVGSSQTLDVDVSFPAQVRYLGTPTLTVRGSGIAGVRPL
jgi:Putative auto-transporter adhesin, head GIN domain